MTLHNSPAASSTSFFQTALRHVASTVAEINLDENHLAGAIDALSQTPLPVVCSGVGKSGFIAAKMAATLNSLGVKAVYLNPTDALHGDLGVVGDGSVVVLISNSGTTAELRSLVPSLQARSCQMISVVSNGQSPLAQEAAHVINYGKIQEVDANGLAPTTSTVVQLALVDVLAAAVSQARGFQPTEFHRNHPAGALGKRLMKVESLMRDGDQLPIVGPDSPLVDVLSTISEKLVGSTCVTDDTGRLVGLITDGDIRRGLERRIDFYSGMASDLMQLEPQTAIIGELVERLLKKNDYLGRHFTIPVVDDDGKLHGILVSIDLI